MIILWILPEIIARRWRQQRRRLAERSGGSYIVKLYITATAAARGSAGRQDDTEKIGLFRCMLLGNVRGTGLVQSGLYLACLGSHRNRYLAFVTDVLNVATYDPTRMPYSAFIKYADVC